jgi:hypothetical protein
MEPTKRLVFAAPTLLMAVLFLLAAGGDYFLPGTDAVSLSHVMQIEYLAVASGLFLIMPAVVAPQSRGGQIVRGIVFLGLAFVFAAAAYSINKVMGMLSYAVLIYASYGGNTLLMKNINVLSGIGVLAPVRWIINLPLFFGLLVYFDLGEGNIESWDQATAVLPFGAAFFSMLLVLELTLYYSMMKKIVEQAARNEIDQRKTRYFSLFK